MARAGALIKLYFNYPDNSDYTIFGYESDFILPFSQLPLVGDSIYLGSVLTERGVDKLKAIYQEEKKHKNLPDFECSILSPLITSRELIYEDGKVNRVILFGTANFRYSEKLKTV